MPGLFSKLTERIPKTLYAFGASLVLRSLTGGSEIVESLAHVWSAADRLSPSVIDPLDNRVLDMIET